MQLPCAAGEKQPDAQTNTDAVVLPLYRSMPALGACRATPLPMGPGAGRLYRVGGRATMSELSDIVMNAIGSAWPWMLTGAILALAGAIATSTRR